MAIKYLNYIKINGVNPSYPLLSKVIECFEEISKTIKQIKAKK